MARTPPSVDSTSITLSENGDVYIVPQDVGGAGWVLYQVSGSTFTALSNSVGLEAGYSVQAIANPSNSNLKEVVVVTTGSVVPAITSSFVQFDFSASPTDVLQMRAVDIVQPDEIPGLYAWFRSDTLAVQSGTQLQSWGDRSGLGNMDPFTFFTTDISDSAVVLTGSLFNGHPYIEFERTRFTSSFRDFPYFGTASNITTFLVSRYRGGNFSNGYTYYYFGASSVTSNSLGIVAASTISDSSQFVVGNVSTTFNPTRGFVTIKTFQLDANRPVAPEPRGMYVWYNGAQADQKNGTFGRVTNNGVCIIGGIDFLAGTEIQEFAEIIIYEGNVTGSQMDSVHNYLSNRYNIELTGVL